MRTLLLKALAAMVVLAAITMAAIYQYARRSLPVIDGTITVAGITAPIDIIRDADAIPHIFAAVKQDAFFGLGYAHAQDRLWQMEFQRRIGHGRLSEIFGAATIPQDRFLRTVGFGRAARAAWDATPDWAKQQVNAYVAGVNAFISTHHGSRLPPEFSLLRVEPEPWTGPDVVAWVKMMAWDLSANYSFELLRHDLVRAVGFDRMTQLMPLYPEHGLSITGDYGDTGEPGQAGEAGGAVQPGAAGKAGGAGKAGHVGGNGRARDASTSAMAFVADQFYMSLFAIQPLPPVLPIQPLPPLQPFLPEDGLGSNNWVVDGTLTASGKPMLANDPHLGSRIPSTWYLAHLTAGDFEIVGATLPGAPTVALGRNRRIAWGATNVAADVEDLYRERLDAEGRAAEFRGAMEPVTVIPETITVKDADPVRIDVRVTRHGPLISDALNANATESRRTPKPPLMEPLAFRWTALDPDDSTLVSMLKMNEARNWNEFTTALTDFVVPSQNWIYADVDGHIGYYAPGRIPIRMTGDGTLPADGWSGNAEWNGWVPFDQLPHLYDPPSHIIVTANHRPAPASYPYNLGFDWYEPYRAQRIVDLLKGRTKLTSDDFARMQADTVSLHAKALVPLLVAHARPSADADRKAAEMLRPWNFDATADSAATAIFQAWFWHLVPALVADDLGPLVTDAYQAKFSFTTRFIINTLTTNDTSWCDDKTTTHVESCDDAVTRALHEAVVDLTRRLGGDMSRWRWDAVHHAVFPHQGLDAVAALRPLLSRSVPAEGDWSTINIGTVAADLRYEQHLVPGYREIIDLSPANDSRFLDAIGESGHPLSLHYDDFLADWRLVRHRTMRMIRADIEKGAIGRLRLVP